MDRKGIRSYPVICLLTTVLVTESALKTPGGDSIARVPQPHHRAAFAERIFVLTDVILAHHIDPPTRQEMILGGLRGLYDEKLTAWPNMSSRASAVQSQDDLTALLAEAWPKSAGGRSPSQETLDREGEPTFLRGLLNVVPGRPSLESPKEARVQSQLQANRYVGIGIALGANKSKQAWIVRTFPGGPADRAGIRGDDLIEEIDRVPVKPGTPIRDVIERLRGPEGSRLVLRMRRAAAREPLEFHLTRLPVMIASVNDVPETAKRLRDASLRIAHLRIGSITASTARELASWESRLRASGTQALILDFRGSGRGGAETEHAALLLADSLLAGKPLGTLRRRDGVRAFTADRDCLFRDWPVAILVDENTSGPAEWVAAALQDADPPRRRIRRAVVIGVPTAGNNFVLSNVPVPHSNEVLVLATGRWERPNPSRDDDRADGAWELYTAIAGAAIEPTSSAPAATFRSWRLNPDLFARSADERRRAESPARRSLEKTLTGESPANKLDPGPDAVTLAIEQLQRQWTARHKLPAPPAGTARTSDPGAGAAEQRKAS